MPQKIKPEYILLGLGAAGLAYWYFFVRPKPPPEGPYEVSVKVEGSGPIGGATIHLDGFSVGSTDAVGMLAIPNVTAGTHTIGAVKYGYEPASTTISIPETTSVTLMLTPIPPPPPDVAAVTIVVREKVHDVPPIEGVKVELADLTEYTDAGGYAFFPEVPVTWKTLKASKPGFKTWEGTIRISTPETRAYIYLERA